MTAEFDLAAQASTAEHEARIRSLQAERREADEEAARQHAAAMQGAQHAHKLEKVPLHFLRESSQWWCCSAKCGNACKVNLPVSIPAFLARWYPQKGRCIACNL